MIPDLAIEIVRHHLELFGVECTRVGKLTDRGRPLAICADSGLADMEPARDFAGAGGVVVALSPRPDFCDALGVMRSEVRFSPPLILRLITPAHMPWSRLRTLHVAHAYRHAEGERVVATADGDAVWMWLTVGHGGILLIGSDVAADLVRYRQGDPDAPNHASNAPVWGFSFERPLYLFEKQLEGEAAGERHADWWANALLHCICQRIALPRQPLLPGGAPGAVVITGDDDQAYLEKYAEQLDLLDGCPVTYFLHPSTRHTPQTLDTMLGRRGIEVELHPDSLDAPELYGTRLAEQVDWFRSLTGRSPCMVRNHGFLNDGYWGHLRHWLKHGISGNANLPGLDGRVLNGSLLPARIVYDDALTPHWSLLTVFGDGMLSVGGYSASAAAERIAAAGEGIRRSAVPGVIMLNLHPQNVAEAEPLHRAVLELIRNGFLAWNLGQCLRWFSDRTRTPFPTEASRRRLPIGSRLARWLRRKQPRAHQ